MRVLLIDDDPEQLALRRRIVEHAGHVVETAADFPAALGQSADVVVTDLHLPGLAEGLAVVRHFAGRARIIVLSGYAGDLDGLPEKALVAAVLEKPVRSAVLLAALAGSAPADS